MLTVFRHSCPCYHGPIVKLDGITFARKGRTMIGAIAGDVIGSVYERGTMKRTDFPLFRQDCEFTDDTVLTVAVADCLLTGANYAVKFKEYYRVYPAAGYGGSFHRWARSDSMPPYNSWGNGSAMRVSPVGFALDTLADVLAEAKRSAEVTHNHPEGIKGAQAIASAVFLARTGTTKADIKQFVEETFRYRLDEPIDSLREHYRWDVSCQGSVPPAIRAFLESEEYEDAIRRGISIGGDSDTIACMAGGIAQAYYGSVPEFIVKRVENVLDDRLREVVDRFRERFGW
jgi:ADP-ribosylglycohydrolase